MGLPASASKSTILSPFPEAATLTTPRTSRFYAWTVIVVNPGSTPGPGSLIGALNRNGPVDMIRPRYLVALKVLRDAALIFVFVASAYWLGSILGAL